MSRRRVAKVARQGPRAPWISLAVRRQMGLGAMLALVLPGCAVDPKTGAQSFAGVKVSDDPCSMTATRAGAVLGGIVGAVVANQVRRRNDARLVGIAAGAGIGALIGRDVDRRRCELFKIAKKHDVEIIVASIELPQGPLAAPGGESAASTGTRSNNNAAGASTAADASATNRVPVDSKSSKAVAGLSVTLRDTGGQFEPGSDRLLPRARAFFAEIAEQYSYDRQASRLAPSVSNSERENIEALRDKRILLIGHTDDTGGSRLNADLSERRAIAVAKVFGEQGIAENHVFYQGAGETLPVADNRSEAGRAQNRRVEIVDVTDDASFQRYLATRRQRLDFYRVNLTVATKPPPAAATTATGSGTPLIQAAAPARSGPSAPANSSTPRPSPAHAGAAPGRTTPALPAVTPATRPPAAPPELASVQSSAGERAGIDFGGVPASTVTAAADFGTPLVPTPSFSLISTAYASGGPVVPACSADRPRVSNGVKSLRDQKDISVTEYMPGLYNTSWLDTVNGNLVGLSNVAVYRDGGSPANRPNLFIYKGYKPGSGAKPDFTAQPEVNAYRGDKAILYRVFVDGPVKCIDLVFPYDNSGEARNSNLFYDKQSSLFVAAFKPRIAR